MRYYCVYIATNQRNTVFYTGITNDLQRRISEHKQKKIKGFTSRYNIDKLVYYEVFQTASEAIAAEKKIKSWSRQKKMELITEKNPHFDDLAVD
ncbi:MAG: GIY-YIG nuclease family protein [bacterium]|nr:GIY-YIG nuclease family protein [bacterium]MDZ4299736.1 GIY-YIG nuclease family protein [Candidatus Sungbacteria bacterium]